MPLPRSILARRLVFGLIAIALGTTCVPASGADAVSIEQGEQGEQGEPGVPGVPAGSPADLPGVLLSRHLMDDRGLEIGDVVRFASRPDGGRVARFRVAGQHEPVPSPMMLTQRRHEARFHLPDLQSLLADPGYPETVDRAGGLNVLLQDGVDPREFALDVRRRMPTLSATAVEDVSVGQAEVFVTIEKFHEAIAVVTVIGSAAFLLALMVMRVEDRRETAGILRLIGFRRRRILLEVLFEAMVIAVAGAAFGALFAAAMQGGINAFFQWYYDKILVFVRITPALALKCIAIAVPLGVAAGLVASATLLRRDIVRLIHR